MMFCARCWGYRMDMMGAALNHLPIYHQGKSELEIEHREKNFSSEG